MESECALLIGPLQMTRVSSRAAAVKEVSEAYERHVRDSLALLPVLDTRMATALAARNDAAPDGRAAADEAVPASSFIKAAAGHAQQDIDPGLSTATASGVSSGRRQAARVPPDGLSSSEHHSATADRAVGTEGFSQRG